MKIILSSPIVGEIAQLKDMLEKSGIVCFTKNESCAGLVGDIPLTESTPELWIHDDDRLAEALDIKRVWRSAEPVAGSPWTCPSCGEISEPQFTTCWKCGAAKADHHL